MRHIFQFVMWYFIQSRIQEKFVFPVLPYTVLWNIPTAQDWVSEAIECCQLWQNCVRGQAGGCFFHPTKTWYTIFSEVYGNASHYWLLSPGLKSCLISASSLGKRPYIVKCYFLRCIWSRWQTNHAVSRIELATTMTRKHLMYLLFHIFHMFVTKFKDLL